MNLILLWCATGLYGRYAVHCINLKYRSRARHLPFVIDAAGRQAWLDCFFKVLNDAPARYGFPPEHVDGFKKFLEDFSAWMVNTQV